MQANVYVSFHKLHICLQISTEWYRIKYQMTHWKQGYINVGENWRPQTEMMVFPMLNTPLQPLALQNQPGLR